MSRENAETILRLYDAWMADSSTPTPTGRTSGIELEFRSYAIVWTLRARAEFTRTRDEALEAVGLPE